MQLLGSFIDFLNNVLGFTILGIPLFYYLMTFTAIEFVIQVLHAIKDR